MMFIVAGVFFFFFPLRPSWRAVPALPEVPPHQLAWLLSANGQLQKLMAPK